MRFLASLVLAFVMSTMSQADDAPAVQDPLCTSEFGFPIEELEDEVIAGIFQSVRQSVESYFGVSFSAFCIDSELYGAYYNLKTKEIVVGAPFIIHEANPPGNLNVVISTIAHEAAHAFQATTGILDALRDTNPHRVKCIELHADFIAGAYMRSRSQNYDVDLSKMASVFYSFGDNFTDSNDHHGRAGERFLAFTNGASAADADIYTISTMGMIYVSGTDCDN